MQTPTTTTRENSGALGDDPVDHARARRRTRRPPGRFGLAPSASAARQTCRQGTGQPPQLLHRADARARGPPGARRRGARARRPPRTASPRPGSTTTSAPQARASARRPGGEVARDHGARRRCALSMQITARPTGPQPITIATVPFLTSPRRTACQPTAIGSVSAASSGASPFGTGIVERLLDHQLLGVGARRLRPRARSRGPRRRAAAAAPPRPACRSASVFAASRTVLDDRRRRTRARTRPPGRSA